MLATTLVGDFAGLLYLFGPLDDGICQGPGTPASHSGSKAASVGQRQTLPGQNEGLELRTSCSGARAGIRRPSHTARSGGKSQIVFSSTPHGIPVRSPALRSPSLVTAADRQQCGIATVTA